MIRLKCRFCGRNAQMRIDHYIRVSIIRGPGFSRWNACRDRADSQESLIRLKPRLLSSDIRMKHSKSSNPSAQKRVPRPWFGSGAPVGKTSGVQGRWYRLISIVVHDGYGCRGGCAQRGIFGATERQCDRLVALAVGIINDRNGEALAGFAGIKG